jgi:hypothetical protein
VNSLDRKAEKLKRQLDIHIESREKESLKKTEGLELLAL